MESDDSMTNFQDWKTFHDRVLLVDGKKFYVQSGLLSVWSEFFRCLFSSNFNEKTQEEIKLEELSAEEFEVFLRLLYGELFRWKESDFEVLARLSSRFIAPKVLTICQHQLETKFYHLNLPNLLDLACTYDMHDTKKKILEHVYENGDFRLIPAFLEVAFNHNLYGLESRLRQRDATMNYPTMVPPLKATPNISKKRKLSAVEIAQEKAKVAVHRDMEESSVIMVLQRGGMTEIQLHRRNSPEPIKNVLLWDAFELIQSVKPCKLTINNADAHQAKICWANLKELFFGKLTQATFELFGFVDMWNWNITITAGILSEVIAKMIEKEPRKLFINVSKTGLALLAELHDENSYGSNILNFSIDFVGGWDTPQCYSTLFPLMLKDLKDIKNLFILFDLPCKSCIEWIFDPMEWTFDDSTVKPVEEYKTSDGDTSLDRTVMFHYIQKMLKTNEFTDKKTGTKVTYFFMKKAHERLPLGLLKC